MMATVRIAGLAWLGLLVGFPAAADPSCVKDGIQLFPAVGSVIPTNARFVLEGVGKEQARVAAMVGQEVVLQTEDDKVTCKVLKGWKSPMNRTAVVLRPRAWLKPNRTYRLMIDDALPNFRVIGVGNDLPMWSTGKGTDDRAPKWVDKPAVSESSYANVKGEISRWIKLRMTITEESPAYLVLSVKKARGSGTAQSYFAPINGGDAMIGHDACGGNFAIEDGQSYRATIEAFDAAQNAAPSVPAIEFRAPKQTAPR